MKKRITVDVDVELNDSFWDQSDPEWLKESQELVVDYIEEMLTALLQPEKMDTAYDDTVIVGPVYEEFGRDKIKNKKIPFKEYVKYIAIESQIANTTISPINIEKLDEQIREMYSKFHIEVNVNE